jgi:hypothetical protein
MIVLFYTESCDHGQESGFPGPGFFPEYLLLIFQFGCVLLVNGKFVGCKFHFTNINGTVSRPMMGAAMSYGQKQIFIVVRNYIKNYSRRPDYPGTPQDLEAAVTA